MKKWYVFIFIIVFLCSFTFIASAMTTEDIECLKTQHVSSFSTNFESSTDNRKYNIKLATSHFDWVVVEPGEVLSFNNIVGERTKERGYKESIVISYGEYVEGIGGGVCQVSTTLYNAWIRAGLKVEYVKNHTLPTSYVDLSLDATVSTYTDLILLNDSDDNVIINGTTKDDVLTFDIYAKKTKYEIKVKSKVIKVIKPQPPIIEYIQEANGRTIKNDGTRDYVVIKQEKYGYISEAYLMYYENGKLVKQERIRQDTYSPIQGTIGYFSN